MRRYVVLCVAVAALSFIGCSAEDEKADKDSVEFIEPPDVGDVMHFNGCSATPRRALTEFETCQIKAYSERCNPEDDCFVSCISSPDSPEVGGGCAHVCSLPLHKGGEPPPGLKACVLQKYRAEG